MGMDVETDLEFLGADRTSLVGVGIDWPLNSVHLQIGDDAARLTDSCANWTNYVFVHFATCHGVIAGLHALGTMRLASISEFRQWCL